MRFYTDRNNVFPATKPSSLTKMVQPNINPSISYYIISTSLILDTFTLKMIYLGFYVSMRLTEFKNCDFVCSIMQKSETTQSATTHKSNHNVQVIHYAAPREKQIAYLTKMYIDASKTKHNII